MAATKNTTTSNTNFVAQIVPTKNWTPKYAQYVHGTIMSYDVTDKGHVLLNVEGYDLPFCLPNGQNPLPYPLCVGMVVTLEWVQRTHRNTDGEIHLEAGKTPVGLFHGWDSRFDLSNLK